MKSIYSFIVKPSNERRYDNIQKLDNTDFITSVSEEDHKSANRFATVVSIPINYNGEIKEGDKYHQLLYEYIRNIKFGSNSCKIKLPAEFQLIKEHQMHGLYF